MHTQRGNKNKLNQTSVSLQSSPSSIPVESDAAEIREAKQLEEEEKEERDRVVALLQRKKVLQELGLVEQLRRLLQGCAEGGAVMEEDSIPQFKAQARRQVKVTRVLDHFFSGHTFWSKKAQCLCLHLAGSSDTDVPQDESAAAAPQSQGSRGNVKISQQLKM